MEKTEKESLKESLSSKLLGHFSFDKKDFSPPIPWIDGVGLSRVRKFSNGYASLYKIGIYDEEIENNSPVKNLKAGVSYGKETTEGITFDPEGRGISSPIDLDFRDDFSYDISTGVFYYESKEITPEQILWTMEDKHLKPMKKMGGFLLRCRLWFWRKLLPLLIKYLDISLIWLLWLISGETIKDDIWQRIISNHTEKFKEPIPEAKVKFEEPKTMEFFGYKAKRWSVVFYCCLHLGLFRIFFLTETKIPWAITMFENNFLALCYVVASFAVTEALIPGFLKSMINKFTPKVYSSVSLKSLKV